MLLKEKKLLRKYTPAGVDAFLARPHGQPVVVGVDDEETGHALRRGRSRSGSTRCPEGSNDVSSQIDSTPDGH